MSISLTENAAKHAAIMLEKRGHGIGLRLATKKSGCTGFAYVVDYADASNNADVVYESFGIKLVIDKTSLQQLDGLEVDYVKNGALNQGFEFRNPNVKEMCGCGESFNV